MTNTTIPTDKKQKLLIIEDEGEMCLLINMLLDGKGLEVEHVKNISGTVEYLQHHQPAIVLLDNRLPDGFGVDLISFIRKKYPATKIIMISGVDTTIKDLALENGADAFLEKPFTKAEIWQVINSFLN